MRPASSTTFEPHLLRCLGLALWLVAGLACVWELLALQPPDSPLHLGVLAGPVAQLASFSFALGTVSILIGTLWPTLYDGGGGRAAALLLALGSLLQVGALTYAASRGLLAVQLLDPRTDARFTLYVRAVAHLATLLGVALPLIRHWRSR
jgi:hypothetical protein